MGYDKKNDYTVIKLHTCKEDHPLLDPKPTILNNKDARDGQLFSTSKKHKKAASTSSYMVFNDKKSPEPPWENDGLLPSEANIRLELDHIFIFLEKVWNNTSNFPFSFRSVQKEAEHFLKKACESGHFDAIKNCLTSKYTFIQRIVFLSAYCNNKDMLNFLAKEITDYQFLYNIDFKHTKVTLLHLVAHLGLSCSVKELIDNYYIPVDINDENNWKPIHYAVAGLHLDTCNLLIYNKANVNVEGPYNITPLHIASFRNSSKISESLVEHSVNSCKYLTLSHPRHSSDLDTPSMDNMPKIVQFFYRENTPLHSVIKSGNISLLRKYLDKESNFQQNNIDRRSPLGQALFEGNIEVVKTFIDYNVTLTDSDMNWRSIHTEDEGKKIVKLLLETKLAPLDYAGKDGFTLLHLAASKGYLGLLQLLLNKGVDSNVETAKGETAIFAATERNHMACFNLLLKKCNVNHITKRGSSILHIASKCNNFAVLDVILNLIAIGNAKVNVDVNLADKDGYTAIYYAINSGRFDIVQRLLQFSIIQNIHLKATQEETLLQFYTERNLMGQYDNAIVRVLEFEKAVHARKDSSGTADFTDQISAEKCIRLQLGTTEGSNKAKQTLAAMYDSTPLQHSCWNFWLILTCFIMPIFLYALDLYTDVMLAFEYYNDYKLSQEVNSTIHNNENFIQAILKNPTENQAKANFLLTIFFILVPTVLLWSWSFYVHLSQDDILPCFKGLSTIPKILIYLICTPLGPVLSYIENTFAQVQYVNKSRSYTNFNNNNNTLTSTTSLNEGDCNNLKIKKTNDSLRKSYNLKHSAQMRVAIMNVLEATLESAFQLVLQLYIVGTQYNELKALQFGEITLGSFISLKPSNYQSQSRLSKQVFSVLISLVSLTWSFTSYHRFSKLGGLKILWSLPLLFAFFFQIISRAISCTVFTLAYTWKIFIVLGVHWILVFFMKLGLEEQVPSPNLPAIKINPIMAYIRHYFYALLGTFTSTFVYFRLERPLGDKEALSKRHSSFLIQATFLLLAFVENVVLLAIGLPHLSQPGSPINVVNVTDITDVVESTASLGTNFTVNVTDIPEFIPSVYDSTFIIVTSVLCLISFTIGVILQWIYYGCFGHPWVNINGPSYERTKDGYHLITLFLSKGERKWKFKDCWNCIRVYDDHQDSNGNLPV